MIDDMERSLALVERMRAALPMRAVANIELRRTLQEASKRDYPHECRATEIWYMGSSVSIRCLSAMSIPVGRQTSFRQSRLAQCTNNFLKVRRVLEWQSLHDEPQ